MKTVDQILQEIHQHRPASSAWLYKQFSVLNIKPCGINQRPQRYPDDTANLILRAFGYLPPAEEVLKPEELRRLATAKELLDTERGKALLQDAVKVVSALTAECGQCGQTVLTQPRPRAGKKGGRK